MRTKTPKFRTTAALLSVLSVVAALSAGCVRSDQAWYMQPIVPPPLLPEDSMWQRDEAGDRSTMEEFPEYAETLSREEAMAVLLNTNLFPVGSIGEAGVDPVHDEAFRAVLAEPEAPAAFAYLVENARPAGQLIGLCGQFLVDHSAYEMNLPRFRDSNQPVPVQSGCITWDTPMSQIVWDRDEGTVHPRPGQTFREAYIETRDKHGGLRYDIVGGGYPYEFGNCEAGKTPSIFEEASELFENTSPPEGKQEDDG
ncbi:MAG: hypothetical protein ACLFV7_05745 [Phycisphaerae bacterium]